MSRNLISSELAYKAEGKEFAVMMEVRRVCIRASLNIMVVIGVYENAVNV